MPILPSFRARVLLLAKQGLGWEDIAVQLECHGVTVTYVRDIVLETAPGHRGAKAGPADGKPSLPAGPDIRRQP